MKRNRKRASCLSWAAFYIKAVCMFAAGTVLENIMFLLDEYPFDVINDL